MRDLNRKQRNMLRKWVKERYGTDLTKSQKPYSFNCERDMDDDVYWDVLNENEFETINAHIDCFIDDMRCAADLVTF